MDKKYDSVQKCSCFNNNFIASRMGELAETCSAMGVWNKFKI
jgi:hypothetical protein